METQVSSNIFSSLPWVFSYFLVSTKLWRLSHRLFEMEPGGFTLPKAVALGREGDVSVPASLQPTFCVHRRAGSALPRPGRFFSQIPSQTLNLMFRKPVFSKFLLFLLEICKGMCEQLVSSTSVFFTDMPFSVL